MGYNQHNAGMSYRGFSGTGITFKEPLPEPIHDTFKCPKSVDTEAHKPTGDTRIKAKPIKQTTFGDVIKNPNRKVLILEGTVYPYFSEIQWKPTLIYPDLMLYICKDSTADVYKELSVSQREYLRKRICYFKTDEKIISYSEFSKAAPDFEKALVTGESFVIHNANEKEYEFFIAHWI